MTGTCGCLSRAGLEGQRRVNAWNLHDSTRSGRQVAPMQIDERGSSFRETRVVASGLRRVPDVGYHGRRRADQIRLALLAVRALHTPRRTGGDLVLEVILGWSATSQRSTPVSRRVATSTRPRRPSSPSSRLISGSDPPASHARGWSATANRCHPARADHQHDGAEST